LSCTVNHRDGYVPGLDIRTDLALEAREEVQKQTAGDVPGVTSQTVSEDGININRVHIKNQEGSLKLGKPPGRYITLEAPGIREKDVQVEDRLSVVLSRELQQLTGLNQNAQTTVMVVGLGNWHVTPDSLGPRVVEDLLVTRHIFELKQPSERGMFSNGFRSVSAFSPGVMGLTGIETGEIIQSVVKRVNPDMVIAIDALAAHRLERLHTTVQITDTGVIPGSGVQNSRLAINQETMGIPVIAMGIPMVVEASTIASEAMDALVDAFQKEGSPVGSSMANTLTNLNWQQKRQMISDVLQPYTGENLMVTPKEIDSFVDDISQVMAGGLNTALHPKMSENQGKKYLQ